LKKRLRKLRTKMSSLYVPDKDFEERCRKEGTLDVRHLGTRLIYSYQCSVHGEQFICYEPDYPYCGPNSVATCNICGDSMLLNSVVPAIGKPFKFWTTRFLE
jgi:hypothetical protein